MGHVQNLGGGKVIASSDTFDGFKAGKNFLQRNSDSQVNRDL